MAHQNSWPKDVDININSDCERKHYILHEKEIYYLISIKRFSQYRRTLRAVSYVIHFANKLKNHNSSNNLLQDEIKQAEIILIRQEISELKKNGKIGKNSSIYKLSAYLDSDEVLRIDGRIDNAIAPDELKHPAIMPKYSYITELLICTFMHNTIMETMKLLSTRFGGNITCLD